MATQASYSPSATHPKGFADPVKTMVAPDKPRVPLVGHIITDEDIGALQVCVKLTELYHES